MPRRHFYPRHRYAVEQCRQVATALAEAFVGTDHVQLAALLAEGGVAEVKCDVEGGEGAEADKAVGRGG